MKTKPQEIISSLNVSLLPEAVKHFFKADLRPWIPDTVLHCERSCSHETNL